MRYLPSQLVSGDAVSQKLAAAMTIYVMMYPEDKSERDESLATMASHAIGKYSSDLSALVADSMTQTGVGFDDFVSGCGDNHPGAVIDAIAKAALGAVAKEVFMPAGGFSSVAAAKGKSHVEARQKKAISELMFSGLCLCTLFQIAEHHASLVRGDASMNKVFWLLERWRPFSWVPKAESTMREIWKRYKNVSHLGAACVHLGRGDPEYPLQCVVDDPSNFLAAAKSFEEFGLRFAQKNTQRPEPVLNPDTIWRVPANRVLEASEMPSLLDTSAQVQLAQYKAPMSL